jgi:hypothetical protein
MESANIPATSENFDTMNLTNTPDNLKAVAIIEQNKTVEVALNKF